MNAKVQPASFRSTGSRIRLLLLALMDIAGMTTTLTALAWILLRESWSLSALAGALMPAILLPSCIFVPVAMMLRGWRSAALNLIPAGVFLVMYGAYFLPYSPVSAAGQEITFLTYNMHTDPEQQEAQAALIREANADIVALQELSEPTAKYFKTALADLYPYQKLYTDGMWVMGRGILSRYPLSNDKILDSGGREIVLRADVINQERMQRFTVYSVHLSTPDWAGIVNYNANFRSANRRDLLRMAANESKPLIMLGDFNMSDASDDYTAIAAHYQDTCRERCAGLPATFPATEEYPFPANLFPPLIRLDYIFHDKGWQALSAEVWYSSGGSDHHPVWAALAFIPVINRVTR